MKYLLALFFVGISLHAFSQANGYVVTKCYLSKDPDSLWKGDFVKLIVEVIPNIKINPNMRVYSSQPSPRDIYTAAALTFDLESRGYKAMDVLKEEGILFTEVDDIAGGTWRYYKKPVKFTQQLQITEDNWKIKANFAYMAGDGDENKDFDLPVNFAPTIERPDPVIEEADSVKN